MLQNNKGSSPLLPGNPAFFVLITHGTPFLINTHFLYCGFWSRGFDNFFSFNPWKEKSQ
jgi:ABC-type arginine/histidine transport system permease subunit